MKLLLCACFLLFAAFEAGAQTRVVQGRVLDPSNNPLPGVAVVEKDGVAGTTTDINGQYTFRVAPTATIVFSYIGYETVEYPAASVPSQIVMREDTQALDEVVVVGYGTQKKVNLSGAVASIDGDAIAAKPSTDVLSALQGEMPGVTVLRSSGEPGAETSGMRIRGFSSANSTATLVLIDGVEGDITLLNPNDIASISVLKDAAASAIYGARAAAGVVLVTTKNGNAGKVSVSYNGFFSFNTPGNMPERLPAWEEQQFINDSRVNAAGSPEWSPEQSSWVANPNFNYRPNNTNGRWDFFDATNWVAEGTKKYTTSQSHNVSVSGGSEKNNYLVSAGYYTKDGLLAYGPDGNDRYTFRVKNNAKLNDHISLSVLGSYEGQFREQNPYGAKSLLSRLFRVRGRQPIYQPEEDINENPFNGDLQVNPIDLMINGGITKTRFEAFTGKGELTIKDYVPGLALRLSASRRAGYYNATTNYRHLVWLDRQANSVRFQNDPARLTRQKNFNFHDNADAVLTYHYERNRHALDLLGGISYERYRLDEVSATARGLISNDFFSFNYYDSANASNTSLSDNIETWAMMSYFGRINYNFGGRYLFEANVRYDGSSRLAPGNRWRAFPSFSGAWRMSEESWFQVPAINNLKLRASWGQLGNGAVLGLYDYIALIENGSNMGTANYYQSNLASRSKTWEIVSSTNVGLDLGVWDNKLTMSADYFWKKNDNMLANLELPSLVGIGVPQSNVGTLKTWGWEFEVAYKNQWRDLTYRIAFNLSDSDNKVVRYDGRSTISEGSVAILEGYPLNTIWGYRTDGFWSSRDEYLAYKEANPGYQSFSDNLITGGDVKYVAQGKADHTIGAGGGTPDNPGDLVCLGNSNGRYHYGISVALQWRGFDLSVMFQGVGKRALLIPARELAPFSQSADMPWTIHRDYWTPDNPDAFWPRIYNYNSYSTDAFNYHASDRWVQDASYIRLKNITLGYTVPIRKSAVEKLRIYISGNDVWEHSNLLKVFDPEVGNEPSASYYPFFRTWTVGINFTL